MFELKRMITQNEQMRDLVGIIEEENSSSNSDIATDSMTSIEEADGEDSLIKKSKTVAKATGLAGLK